eukprot:GEMP01043882.1.p1 GENE.GEMP01043882.1~~GEMP01043882.1.p1  ORF type:complete len:400 (+),score=64.23 GEMP01043882.1:80-1279(+)
MPILPPIRHRCNVVVSYYFRLVADLCYYSNTNMAIRVLVSFWTIVQWLECAVRATTQTKVDLVKYDIAKVYKKPSEACFTQGLIVEDDESIVESCGMWGKSHIRKYRLNEDGSIPPIDKRVDVAKGIFLEGIAAVGTFLWALTYQKQKVLRFDRITWAKRKTVPWKHREGWGLATDGCGFFANNGGSEILHLNAAGVETKQVTVRRNGVSVDKLNDMMYVAPKLWINVWLTDDVYRVDPHTGVVEKRISLKKLGVKWNAYTEDRNNTPNGIVYDNRLDPTALFVTGKLWADIYKLTLSAEDLCGDKLQFPNNVCTSAPPTPCWDGTATERPEATSPVSTVRSEAPSPVESSDASSSYSYYAFFVLIIPISLAAAWWWRKRRSHKEKPSASRKAQSRKSR